MTASIIILLISLILDGILTNFLPYLVGDLSIFTPLFTLTVIFLIYPLFRKKEIHYFILVFITGIIYDLLYTNLLFFNACLFLIMALISSFIYKKLEVDYLKLIIYLILVIILYETFTGIVLAIFNIVPVTISKIIYKITHSLIINIIYGELIYLIIDKLPNKYKKISIN